jgi:hypothetical protein
MERSAWTDERLDDLASAMRDGFGRVDQDIRDLRFVIRDGFASTRQEFTSVRAEIDALRLTMLRVGGGLMIGLVGVIAAILARGV